MHESNLKVILPQEVVMVNHVGEVVVEDMDVDKGEVNKTLLIKIKIKEAEEEEEVIMEVTMKEKTKHK